MKIFLGYTYTSWTTGAYWERALARQAEVVYVGTDKENCGLDFQAVDIVKRLEGASKEDVFIYIDSGRSYFPKNIEKLPLLTACYLIDVHVNLQIRLEIAKFFDIIFVAQKDYVEIFKANGFQNVWWIPLGCEPEVYQHLKLPLIYDVGFVGHVHADMVERKRLLSLLSQRYHMNDYARFYSPEETSRIYSGSKVIFNCSIKGDLNMRVFEGMSCGRLLLTDSIANGLGDIFENKRHLVIYDDDAELLESVDYYLTNENERERIALCGSELVRSRHSYEYRIKEVLSIISNMQKQKGNLTARWRHASAAAVSISRCKLYSHWELPEQILGEWQNGKNIKSYLWRSYYLLKIFLALIKQKIKKLLGR